MIVYVLFATRYIEDHYQVDDFVCVFSTFEKAEAYIHAALEARKRNCKRRLLEQDFLRAWEENNPAPSPSYWDKYDRSQKRKQMSEHSQKKSAAVREYMATIDLNAQDVSDIDLVYYGEQDNFSISSIELK